MGGSAGQLMTGVDLDAIRSAGQEQILHAGQRLIAEGDEDETVYLILEGELEVYKTYTSGRHRVSVLTRGQWVGEIAFIKEIPRTSEVVAAKHSTVLRFGREEFASLSPVLQLALKNTFAKLAMERIDQLIQEQEEVDSRQQDLMNFFSAIQDSERRTYSQSGLIQTIIQSIPRLPMYAGDLIGLVHDTESNAGVIASRIGEDPSLTAQVLKYVNSPYFGFAQGIADLHHAVALLGVNQIYQLVLYSALRGTMPDTPEFSSLQEHSVVVSVLATELAGRINPSLQAHAATLGLLHDIGKSVVLLLKGKYPQMDGVFDSLDTAVLGSMLLEQWNLPRLLCEGVFYQNLLKVASPELWTSQFLDMVALLSLSHLAAQYLTGEHGELPDTLLSYMEERGLSVSGLEELVDKVLVPELMKKQKGLPAMVRSVLKTRADERSG
jgi:HD-like signal output (HDOD) protein